AAADADSRGAAAASARAGRLRLLVVDDDESVRELLREILEAEGHAVSAASSGPEALSLFRPGDYDAVFTDIGMPGMSGWEFAEAVRRLDGAVPLAVITGWGEAVGSERQREAQVDWVVTKPFNATDIVGLAANVAGRLRGERVEEGLHFAQARPAAAELSAVTPARRPA
ncbi:MAG TPA: response regulator, partial [Pyrinomonadaceae bacterium]|nr:response regulator [Pyrinomonadaceae bacterium]